MGCFLGIDQGGTKTCVAVCDYDGNILSHSRAGGAYFPGVGIEKAIKYIKDASDDALAQAGKGLDDIDCVVAGITGIDWDGDDKFFSGELKKIIGNKEIIVCNDSEIAYYGGTTGPTGAVICAGTGINSALISPGGKKFVMGDYLKNSLQGSSAISRLAIEAVFESAIGALPETKLTDLFLEFSKEADIDALMKRFYCDQEFSVEIRSLTPQIKKFADEGDEVALMIQTSFAEELTRCFLAAMKKMNMLDLKCDIVLAGSVFGRNDGLTVLVSEKIKRYAKNVNILVAGYEPVVGACILGILEKKGIVDENTTHNLAVSAEKFGLLKL